MTAHRVDSVRVQCPYCWEKFEIIVDCSVESQEYIEDCEVCCRPILLDINVDGDSKPEVVARGENE